MADEEPDPFDAPETPNAGNEAGVAEAKKTKRQREAEEGAVLQSILSSSAGRRWYANLVMNVCGLHRTTENAAYDTNGIHFREGARQIALYLHQEALQKARPQYMVLLAENLN